MTTTTSTTTGASAVQTATKSLLSSLDAGSGVDTASLVTSLVEAQFAARTAQLTARSEKLTAQISGVATLKSAISGFSNALDTLAKGGTLTTQPKSGSAAVLGATALPGAKLSGLTSSLRVDRLAAGQGVATPRIMAGSTAATRSTVLGSGSFTLQLGTAAPTTTDGVTRMAGFQAATGANTSVTFSLTNATPDTIAAAINEKAATLGITASVVTGADGSAYLSLKGRTGAANAFTLSASGAGLEQFAVGDGTALTSAAANAALVVDGVAVERATNTIEDLVAGVKLELAGPGATTLTATKPTEGLTQAVQDVVETYNTVLSLIQEQTDARTGQLYGDPAAQSLLKNLKSLTLTAINPGATGAGPRTLSELGVRTARDGTLSVDTGQLAKVLAAAPDAVEAMFQASTVSTAGLPAVLARMSSAATSATFGLGASTARYAAAQGDLAKAQEKIISESEGLNTRLTAQFAAMNARVSTYKSVQSFLTNQIAAWNKSDG